MSLKDKKVLILDDDPDFRLFVKKILEHQGMEVLQTATIAEAMAVLEVNLPHLLIVDLNLAGETGFDLLKTKSTKVNVHSIPILICSAYGHRKILESLVGLGVYNILIKPINNYRLIKKVRQVLLNWKSPFYYRFEEESTRPTGEISVAAELSGLNEIYGVVNSPVKMDEESKWTAEIELFRSNNIKVQNFEITSSAYYQGPGNYKSHVIFLGCSEESASRIRKLQSAWGAL